MQVLEHDYRRKAGAVVIANPNALTGIAFTRAQIVQLPDGHPDIPIAIDEAYIDFGGESVVTLIAHHPNLLVVQMMLKLHALAGLLIGYALGDEGFIEALRSVKDAFNSYPVGRIVQAGALAPVRDDTCFRKNCARIVAEPGAMTRELAGLGFVVLPPYAILFSPGIPHGANWSLRRRCASTRSRKVISVNRAPLLICALRSEQKVTPAG